MSKDNPTLIESATFPRHVIAEIQRAAKTGIYDIRGFGAKRDIPTFDDLVFLGASTSRYPLEGYREKCTTEVILGNRFAKNPIHLKRMGFTKLLIPYKSSGKLTDLYDFFLGFNCSMKTTLNRSPSPL